MDPANGWPVWQRLVLSELEDRKTEIGEINSELREFRLEITNEITALKVKAGVWGLLAGLIPSIGALLLILLG